MTRRTVNAEEFPTIAEIACGEGNHGDVLGYVIRHSTHFGDREDAREAGHMTWPNFHCHHRGSVVVFRKQRRPRDCDCGSDSRAILAVAFSAA